MTMLPGHNEIITNAGCHVITNAGCFVMSWVHLCTAWLKIVRVRIADYITQKIKFREYIVDEN